MTGTYPVAPTAAEVVSAARTLLDALRYQPDQTGDVQAARRKVEQAIDRHDTRTTATQPKGGNRP